jgi:hypothetical protein
LDQVVVEDPANADAWLWLSGVAADPVEQRAALERVLALDPGNGRAQHGLQWLQQRRPEIFNAAPPAPAAATYETTQFAPLEPEPVAPAPPAEPVVTSAATARMEAVQPPETSAATARMVAVRPAEYDSPQPVEYTRTFVDPRGAAASHSSLDEEFRCPHCGELAGPDDPQCPRCQGSLIVALDRSGAARLSRALLVLLWLVGAGAAIFGTVWLLGEAQQLEAATSGIDQLFGAVGLPATPNLLGSALSWTGLGLGGLALAALLMALALFRRWRPAFVLHLLLAVILTAAAIGLLVWVVPMASSANPIASYAGSIGSTVGGGLLAFGLVQLLLGYASRREFFPRRTRLRLPDQMLAGSEHFRLGTRYLDRGWRWAAAREFERAAAAEPQTLKYRRALADVYASMGDHLRARDELRASLNFAPDTSRRGRAGALAEDVQRERK